MPRKSPFDISLSSEERRKLKSIARKYTSPYCDVIRAKIILLADEGLSNDVIATRLDMPRQIVSKWRKRFSSPDCLALRRSLEAGVKPLFPPASSFKLRRLLVSCLSNSDCPYLGSRSRRSANT